MFEAVVSVVKPKFDVESLVMLFNDSTMKTDTKIQNATLKKSFTETFAKAVSIISTCRVA